MKKIVLSVLSLFLCIVCFAQSQNNYICRLGFTYEISKSDHWGKGLPVVSSVTPYSSAELAGMKQSDIIDAIDGIPVSSITENEITELLNPVNKNEIILTLRSIEDSERLIKVKKDCKLVNTITEEQLATAFSMYSLETTSERQFICPFKITTTTDPIEFEQFKTYAFTDIDENNKSLETVINEHIGKALSSKGLKPESEKPDILIQTFYFFDRNPNYKGNNALSPEKETLYRYDISYNQMISVPFINHLNSESDAQYLLQFGFRLIDQKLQPGRVLWESEANEMLDNSYRLEDYARIHIPLMCMQYPYVKYNKNVPYTISKKSYNYTGIQYDIDRLELVVEVDRNSPAYAAGIQPNDIIEKIGRHKMDRTVDEFSAAYKRFITNTMKYRDPKTQFTDANGFRFCMLWDSFKYTQIANALQQNSAMAPFSYLYYFAPYINPSGNNACTFHIRRGKEKKEITIRPTIKADLVIEIK